MTVNAEWDRLREVMMHRPGVEIDYAMLAPKPFLFERPYRTTVAIREHETLEKHLREAGVKVTLLRDAVSRLFETSPAFVRVFRKKLLETVEFTGNRKLADREARTFKRNLNALDPQTLFNILLIEPSVTIKSDGASDPGYPAVNSKLPLANLYFMRDQQAVSGNGIFIGRMRKRHRAKENDITYFILEGQFPQNRVKRLSGRGFFEGGDFMPAGDFCIIGTGPRTTISGALEFIGSGVNSYKEFLIVNNPVYDFMKGEKRGSMVNMHLDTYFNFAGKGLAVGSKTLAQKAKGSVYYLEGGSLRKDRETTLAAYLLEKGFDIIDLNLAEQLSYSSNFLTIKDRSIIAIDSPKVLKRLRSGKVFSRSVLGQVERDLSRISEDDLFPRSKAVREYGLEVSILDLSEITGGYGGAHCMTASISRG